MTPLSIFDRGHHSPLNEKTNVWHPSSTMASPHFSLSEQQSYLKSITAYPSHTPCC
jgi:hypothetical protein